MTLDQNETPSPLPQPEYKTACGGKIKDPSKFPGAEYRAERIYFCTQACLEVFLLNPGLFMTGKMEHPI